MTHLMVKIKVEDYEKWRPVFDENRDLRVQRGERSEEVFQAEEDPNSVTVLYEWDDPEHVREYFGSDQLKEAMKKAGVMGEPELAVLEKK